MLGRRFDPRERPGRENGTAASRRRGWPWAHYGPRRDPSSSRWVGRTSTRIGQAARLMTRRTVSRGVPVTDAIALTVSPSA